MYTSYLSSNRLRGTWTVIPAENNTSFSPVKPSVRAHHREQALRIHDIISLPGKVVHSVFPTALHCSKVLQCEVNKKWKIRWCRSTACVNLVSALRGISCKQGDPISAVFRDNLGESYRIFSLYPHSYDFCSFACMTLLIYLLSCSHCEIDGNLQVVPTTTWERSGRFYRVIYLIETFALEYMQEIQQNWAVFSPPLSYTSFNLRHL